MDKVTKYLVENLTKAEIDLLWQFITNDVSTLEIQSLEKLRLVDRADASPVFCLTQLGEQVRNRTTP